MCSYCGCEAEPLITALMDQHAVIADLAYQVDQALRTGATNRTQTLMVELGQRFEEHSSKEEAGLFAELAGAGEALEMLTQLWADHRRLRPLLASSGLADEPSRLRMVLADLAEHAQTEDCDLFPYALQVLSAEAWDRINHMAAEAVPAP